MVPGGLGEVPNRVNHHQRTLPAARLVCSPDPAVLQAPLRQVLLKPCSDLRVGHGFFALCRHNVLSSFYGDARTLRLTVMPLADAKQTQPPTPGRRSPKQAGAETASVRVIAPARLHLGFL